MPRWRRSNDPAARQRKTREKIVPYIFSSVAILDESHSEKYITWKSEIERCTVEIQITKS